MIYFAEMFIDMSSRFHETLVQLASLDGLLGRQNGLIFEKIIKNLLPGNCKVDEADT